MTNGVGVYIVRIALDRKTRRRKSAAGPSAQTPATRPLHTPLRIGIATGLVALGFAVLRWAVAANGNIAKFVMVGASQAQRARLPKGVPIFPDGGYDGQYYYRLALDPLAWGHRAFGITLDNNAWLGRISYPTLAWVVATGHRSLVPTTLVMVNVIALGVLGGLGAAFARRAGRPPLWGLVLAGYWGFLWTVSRDLTEVVTAAGIIGGLLALRHGRPLLGALALSIAVLSRETVLVVIAALCLARLLCWARAFLGAAAPRGALSDSSGRTGPSLVDLSWVLPLLAFGAWQAAVAVRTGAVPLTASRGVNSGIPFVGAARGIAHYLPLLPSTLSLLWVGEFALLVAFGTVAAISFPSTTALLHERLAWIGYGITGISLAPGIWLGHVGFRSLYEFFLLSWVLMLCSRRRLLLPGGLLGLAWLVVAVQLVVSI